MKTKLMIGFVIAAAFTLAAIRLASATTFTNGSYTFESLEGLSSGTGLGNYNVILFENSPGGSGNASGSVNVDNSNRLLPTGGTNASGSLSWMTSIGDLRAFYDLQFGANTVKNIVLFLDIHETGQDTGISINTLSIYKNATTNPTTPDPTGANDLQSPDQENIAGLASGTPFKQLSLSQSLAQICSGGGCDDWSIFTSIDPYDAAFSVNDTLLFNFQIGDLNAGSEVLAISGTFSACDIDPQGCGTTTGTTGTTSDPTTTTTTGTTSDPTTTTTTGTTSDPTTTTTTGTTSDPTTTTTTGSSSTGTDTTGVTASSTTGESSATSQQIPEPASFLLLGAGLVALSRVSRRKRD